MTKMYQKGDPVTVISRYRDPYIGINLKGFQGRVKKVEISPKGREELEVHWDSVTLNNLTYKYLRRCATRHHYWDRGFIPPHKVGPATERDTLADTTQAQKLTRERYRWIDEFELLGIRIFKVVGGKHRDSEQYAAWQQYLKEKLKFPFRASVEYIDEIDDDELTSRYIEPDYGHDILVMKLAGYDSEFGLLAEVYYKGERTEFPLCNVDMKSFWRRPYLEAYREWFLSR